MLTKKGLINTNQYYPHEINLTYLCNYYNTVPKFKTYFILGTVS